MRVFGLPIGGNRAADAKAQRQASQQSLEQGGLPLPATERLRKRQARQGTAQHLFASSLSVPEFTLIDRLGYEPLGQVIGCSTYHLLWQPTVDSTREAGKVLSQDLRMLTDIHFQTRQRAIDRLQQEAVLLGATGVVGVRLERRKWASESTSADGMSECVATGTAIREIHALPPTADRPPFITTLSGEEFYLIRRAGYRPVGVALGNCAYYTLSDLQTPKNGAGTRSEPAEPVQEAREITRSVASARSLAMRRMEKEARRLLAVGVVGVTNEVVLEPVDIVSDETRRTENLRVFMAMGTAIAVEDGAAGDNLDFILSRAL